MYEHGVRCLNSNMNLSITLQLLGRGLLWVNQSTNAFSFLFQDYLSSASMVRANLYLELLAQNGTPSKHSSVCSSAALLCINRCGGKGREARSLGGAGGLLSGEASWLQPWAQDRMHFLFRRGTCILPDREYSSHSPPSTPILCSWGMLLGCLRHLTFARANISNRACAKEILGQIFFPSL